MRHKAVLAGTQQSALDDFFKPMDGAMQCVTSSLRLEDIENHMDFFHPDFFIFCMKNETAASVQFMKQVKKICRKSHAYFVILGAAKDCELFKREADGVADIVLVKPMAMSKIYEKLDMFYDVLHGKQKIDLGEREQLLSTGEMIGGPDVTVETTTYVSSERSAAEPGSLSKEAAIDAQQLVNAALAGGQGKKKKHILVVDDDPGMLKLIRAHLENEYEVATAINGALALRFLAHKTTDLVLLDYEMPGVDGASILENIRGHEFSKNLPVIFLTGVTDAQRIRKVLALKPDGYLLKPIDREKLLTTLRETLNT